MPPTSGKLARPALEGALRASSPRLTLLWGTTCAVFVASAGLREEPRAAERPCRWMRGESRQRPDFRFVVTGAKAPLACRKTAVDSHADT